MNGTLTKIGGSLASGVENLIAFATSKRVLSMLAAALAAKYGVVSPQEAVIGGSILTAGFTATDALGRGKGTKGNGSKT